MSNINVNNITPLSGNTGTVSVSGSLIVSGSITANGNITLGEVNDILNGNAVFGDYLFETPLVDGIKLKTSTQVIKEFKDMM